MANIVITVDALNIDVEFNDMSSSAHRSEGTWPKAHCQEVSLSDLGYCQIFFDDADKPWTVSAANDSVDGTLLIDSVAGTSPTDNAHLYSLLVTNILP